MDTVAGNDGPSPSSATNVNESGPRYPAAGVYNSFGAVPLSVPWLGWVSSVYVSRSPSGSSALIAIEVGVSISTSCAVALARAPRKTSADRMAVAPRSGSSACSVLACRAVMLVASTLLIERPTTCVGTSAAAAPVCRLRISSSVSPCDRKYSSSSAVKPVAPRRSMICCARTACSGVISTRPSAAASSGSDCRPASTSVNERCAAAKSAVSCEAASRWKACHRASPACPAAFARPSASASAVEISPIRSK